MKTKYYKVLNDDGSCYWGGIGCWSSPENGGFGKWMPKIKGSLSFCKNGYHVLTVDQLLRWLGPAIFEVEVKGAGLASSDKIVYSQARLLRKCDSWNEQTARLFACDCAEHVLPIFEREYPNDKRPREAIAVSRLFAEGKVTKEERDAAWVAAGVAAEVAVRDAAWVAAGVAAEVAAGDAAWVAARVAAEAAARFAAWVAVRDAAWVAARVAAEAAAWAAGAAERKWQIDKLKNLLK